MRDVEGDKLREQTQSLLFAARELREEFITIHGRSASSKRSASTISTRSVSPIAFVRSAVLPSVAMTVRAKPALRATFRGAVTIGREHSTSIARRSPVLSAIV